jgi:hypothetical protein
LHDRNAAVKLCARTSQRFILGMFNALLTFSSFRKARR